MGIFRKTDFRVEEVKKFLEEHNIKWNGALIDAFRKGQNVYINVDDKTFNKLISKPVRLLISSEQFKDVDVVTSVIDKDAFVLHGISNEGYVDLSSNWKDFQKVAEQQRTPEGYEPGA